MSPDPAIPQSPPRLRETFTNLRYWIFFLLTSALYNVFFLRTFSHWWFEDDPYLFGFVKSVRNPLAFFGRQTIKSLGAGGALTPFQAVSEWIDSSIAYRSLFVAHLHNTLSVAVTLMLLFHVLRRFALSTRAAILLCLLWLSLPATIVVSEFLAARHYLEGLTATLLAVAFAQNLGQKVWRENVRTIALLCLTLACAMLCKELYVITAPLFCAIYLFETKRYRAVVSVLALIPVYFAYRYWVFGGHVDGGSAFLGLRDYLTYLWRLPYLIAGNFGGYALATLFVILLILYAWQQGKPGRFLVYAMLILGSQLAVLYPVAFPITIAWAQHGTWCRVMFLLGTMLLLAGGIACYHSRLRYARPAAALVTLGVLAFGAVVTRAEWERLMLQSKREGKFYVANPDRLLYSEVPGAFFLDGVRLLYDIPVRHHILALERERPPADVLNPHQTIWRLIDRKFEPDPQLFAELKAKASSPP